jgi:hypothetical protein
MRKLFLIFVLSAPLCIAACECPPLDPVSKQAAAKYDVVFYGKVDSIIPCGTQGLGTAFFTIKNLYKGVAAQHVSVDYDCTTACMMSFAKNDEWIIYAVFQRFDLLTVGICGHSRKKSSGTSQDFYQLSSHRTFEEENNFLKNAFGIQLYAPKNELNKQQRELKPHNDQPSDIGKLWLLIISLSAMLIVYIVSKKYFKNGK